MKNPMRSWRGSSARIGGSSPSLEPSRRVGARRTKQERRQAGGTLNVGWEQSFGFTDNFDPTGEYLGDAFGHLLRTCSSARSSATTTSPAPRATSSSRTSRRRAEADERRQDVHVQAQERASSSARRSTARSRRRTSCTRSSGSRTRRTAASTPSTTRVIKGWDDYAAGKAKTISGITTPDSSTIVFNLTARPVTSSTAMAMPATAPIPPEVGEVLRGQAGQLRPRPHLDRPVHDRRAPTRSTSRLRDAQAGRAATTARRTIDLVRNPNYNQSDRQQYAEELPRRVQVHRQRERRRHLQQDRGRRARRRARASPPPSRSEKYSTNPSLKPQLLTELRRPHLVPDDEPDAAAVRRRPRPQGDELHHRQAGAPPGVGRPGRRRRSRTTSSRTRCSATCSPTTTPYKTPGDTGSVAKAKAAMKGSKYDRPARRHVHAPRRARTCCMIADARAVDTGMVADRSRPTPRRSASPSRSARSTARTRRSRRPSKNVPISERPGWGKDYADPYTFFSPLFDGRTIIPTGNTNYSLVGITPRDQAKKARRARATCNNVPSVDTRHRQVREADRQRAHRVLRGARQEAHDAGRAVGAVPVGEGDPHHEQERHEVRVRPVRQRRRRTRTWR